MKLIKKILIVSGLLIFGFLVHTATNFFRNKAEGEIHLIPEGYEGGIFIIFDQKNGKPEKYEKGSRVYEISENGILKTQFSSNYGWYPTLKYYYVNGDSRKEILHIDNPESISPESIQVIGGSRGNASYPQNNLSYDYLRYLVCKYENIDSLSKVADNLEKYNLIFN